MRSPRVRPAVAFACLSLSSSAVAQEVEPEHVMSMGAGAMWFVEGELQPASTASPAWSVRYGWEPTPMIGVGLSWFGHTSLDRQREGLRFANLLEYDVKLALAPELPLVPFLSAGLGYGAWYGGPGQTDLVTLTVPMAAGLEVRGDRFVVGARGTYRQVFFDQTTFSTSGADHLALTLEVGNRF